MKKCYAYSRVSSKAQLSDSPDEKFGLSRQKDNAEAICSKHNLQLVELVDAGISGFKESKNNAEHGELKNFLDALDRGEIERGSIFLIEHLSRLGRRGILITQGLVSKIIGAGLSIWVANGERLDVYDKKTMNEIGGAVVLACAADNAYKESEEKQRRHLENWKKKRAIAKNGGLLTRKVPAWIEITPDDKLELIPEKAALIKDIVNRYIGGAGSTAIARDLKAEGVTPMVNVWSLSAVNSIIKSQSIIGDLVSQNGEVIKGYYPRVITDDQWNQLQLVAKKRFNTNIGGLTVDKCSNLFAGLLKCPCCGDRYVYQAGNGGKRNPETGRRAKTYAVRCRNTECKDSAGWSYPLFEKAFFSFVKGIDFSEIFSDVSEAAKLQNKIEAKEGRLLTLDAEIKNAVSLMIKFPDMEEIEQQLSDLKNERDEIKQVIEDLNVSKSDIRSIDTSVSYSDKLTVEQRKAIRNKLPTFIDHILIHAKKGCGKLNKNKGFDVIWKNGKETTWRYIAEGIYLMDSESSEKVASVMMTLDPKTGKYEPRKEKGEVSKDQLIQAYERAGLIQKQIDKLMLDL